MSDIEVGNSTRIAKNTLLLYGRMILLMGISLFTSRLILNALGVEDFGIYNVVGGFVSLFSVVNSALVSSIVRFITFELGVGNLDSQKKVFCTSINIEICIGLIIFVFGETIGLYFLNNGLTIPLNRLSEANIVYQLSLLTLIIGLLTNPYNASIIAHEKMSAFAYLSLIDAFWRLLVAYVLYVTFLDHLVTYAILLSFHALLMRFLYVWYCKRNFQECSYFAIFDKSVFYKMLKFAGWETIGSSAGAIRDQGCNVLLNLFFNPSINAARGVAMQVNTAITSFANNFMMAVNPQITKSYAQNNYDYLMKLIFRGSRFSFYLLFFLSLPVLLNTEYILQIWLTIVPDHTVNFIRIILITGIINSLSETLVTTQNATGNNKLYQIFIGGTNFLTIPIAYIALKSGCESESVFYVVLVIDILRLFLRLPILQRMVDINIMNFVLYVIIKPLFIAGISSVLPIILLYNMELGIIRFFAVCFACVLSVLFFVYYFGLDDEERLFATSHLKRFFIR